MVFTGIRLTDEPGMAVSLYALIPILLGVFWFELRGGLLTAAGAMLVFLLDEFLTSNSYLIGTHLGVAAVNRALVFFGVAWLVTRLLRRERTLALRVHRQEFELAELESLRSALTPPQVMERPNLHLATSFTPAEGVVAGDFYLVVEGPRGSTIVVVGDVVGHGLDAARCATFVRTAMSTFAQFTGDPVQLLRLANSALVENGPDASRFVTAVCVNIGPPGHGVRWAAAGHDAPWDLDTGKPLTGARVGVPLGVSGEILDLEAGHAPLLPGTGVLFFTDGLTEGRTVQRAPGRSVELFGEERAREVILANSGRPVDQVVAALVSAVTAFADETLADDLCVVAVRVHPSPQATQDLVPQPTPASDHVRDTTRRPEAEAV